MQTSEIYAYVARAMARAKISKEAKFEVSLWLREREAFYARKELRCQTTDEAGSTSTTSLSSSATQDTLSFEPPAVTESST